MIELLDYIDGLFEKDFEGHTQLDRKFKNERQRSMQREWEKLRLELSTITNTKKRPE